MRYFWKRKHPPGDYSPAVTNFEGNGDVVGNGDTTLRDVLNVSTVSPVPTPPNGRTT